jgi:hypothetical protein
MYVFAPVRRKGGSAIGNRQSFCFDWVPAERDKFCLALIHFNKFIEGFHKAAAQVFDVSLAFIGMKL